jgi:Lipopolysaccharide biosynthesis proteins, LPS:glycosyltransferases
MNVITGFSSKYFEGGCIAVKSLFENNQNVSQLNLNIFVEGLEKKQLEFLHDIGTSYRREIKLIDSSVIGNLLEGKNIQLWYGSFLSYAKCFCSRLFPEYEKIIFLDADIFVNKSLQSLWDTNLHGNTIGAVKTPTVLFNAGVIVEDLNAWRKKGIDHVFEEKLGIKRTKAVEQDIFNEIFENDFEPLPTIFNFFPLYGIDGYHKYARISKCSITKREYQAMVANPTIIHFNFFGKCAPFFEFDKLMSSKWSMMYVSLFGRAPTLPHRNRFLAGIGGILYKVLPVKWHQKIRSFFIK